MSPSKRRSTLQGSRPRDDLPRFGAALGIEVRLPFGKPKRLEDTEWDAVVRELRLDLFDRIPEDGVQELKVIVAGVRVRQGALLGEKKRKPSFPAPSRRKK
ncbi:MAG: hypothetical protein HY900_24670 [Deltaproteobacteria bacterium]|nr:hypothetical protein [Deltaproteobacteria bacterium]